MNNIQQSQQKQKINQNSNVNIQTGLLKNHQQYKIYDNYLQKSLVDNGNKIVDEIYKIKNNMKLQQNVQEQYQQKLLSTYKKQTNIAKQQNNQHSNIVSILQTLANKIKQLQLTNKNILQTNSYLTKQIISLKQQQNNFQKQISHIESKYNLEIFQLKTQLEIYKKINDKIVNQIGQKCQVQQSKIMRVFDIVDSNGSQKLELGIDSNIPKLSQVSNRYYKNRLNCQKIQELDLPPVSLKPVLINHVCVGAQNYLIDINQRHTNMTYIGQMGIWTQILGRHLIDPQKIIQYLLRITKSHSGAISIGIIDKKYEKIKSCKKQRNCIFYYGGSGRIWESGYKLQKQGNGFKQGDIVIMIVFLREGAIRWYVNGKLEAQYNSSQFVQGKFKDVQWVPFVNMATTKDKVIWQVGE